MKIEEIEKLAEVVQRCDLEEIEIEQEGTKIRIRRHLSPPSFVPSVGAHFPSALEAWQSVTDSEVAPAHKTKTAEVPLETINSPMIGTFYRSPAPGKPAFVETGSVVAPSTTVCVIEAMKVMNEIPAEISGSVVEVLVKDGQPVEFGQPLFKVRA